MKFHFGKEGQKNSLAHFLGLRRMFSAKTLAYQNTKGLWNKDVNLSSDLQKLLIEDVMDESYKQMLSVLASLMEK